MHKEWILTKWAASTRLETRTKESNIYASIWVIKTLMRNESELLYFCADQVGRCLRALALSTDRDLS
jgi:hypothetical protein